MSSDILIFTLLKTRPSNVLQVCSLLGQERFVYGPICNSVLLSTRKGLLEWQLPSASSSADSLIASRYIQSINFSFSANSSTKGLKVNSILEDKGQVWGRGLCGGHQRAG